MLTQLADPILFYESQEGRTARDILRFHVGRVLKGPNAGLRILALGAGRTLYDGPTSMARLSEAQGTSYSCLIDSRNKPLPDDDFDRVIALHACSEDADIGALMIEARRVLKGEGRLLLIVPRAHSRWTRAQTPFANEQGYTARQIAKMLRDRGLYLRHMKRALYITPSMAASGVRGLPLVERLMSSTLHPWGGGVLVVEAEKRVRAAALLGHRSSRSVMVPFSLPQMS